MATISFNSATLKSGNYEGTNWYNSTTAVQGKWNGTGAHKKTQVGLINFSNDSLPSSTAVSQIKFTFTFGRSGYGTYYNKTIKFYECISTSDPKTGLGEYLGEYTVDSAYGNSQTITLTSGDLFNNLISHFKSSYGYKICIYNGETANHNGNTWTRNYLTISAATLEITYENIYTLTIDPNGGSMHNGDITTSSSFTTKFQYGVKTYIGNAMNSGDYYTNNAPTREGYTFTGFSFSPGGTGQLNTAGDRFYFNGGSGYSDATSSYIFNGDYAGDVTATAQWTANIYTLTIDPNGGSMHNGDITTSSSFTTKFQYGIKTYIGNLTSRGTIPSNTPSRTGYTFNNFSFSNGTGGKNTNGDRFYFNGEGPGIGGSSTNSNFYIFNGDYAGDVAVTAQWTPNTYLVTWDLNDGTGSTLPYQTVVEYNSTYGTLPTTPTRVGYTFNGWFTASSGGNQITSNTKVTTANDHRLYAHWELQDGLVSIYTGSGINQGWKKAISYIYTGSGADQGWKQAIPKIYDGSSWKDCQ